MTIYTSYEVSKRLQEFLGKSAPDPIDKKWHYQIGSIREGLVTKKRDYEDCFLAPAYQLHDLLSKPFCEAMAEKLGWTVHWATAIRNTLTTHYYNNGFVAVEKELLEMMAWHN